MAKERLTLLDWLTIIAIILVLVALFVAPANAQVEYPQTIKTGKVVLIIPGDSISRVDNLNSTLKRTQTTYYVSKSLAANITVTSIEYKDVNVVRPGSQNF